MIGDAALPVGPGLYFRHVEESIRSDFRNGVRVGPITVPANMFSEVPSADPRLARDPPITIAAFGELVCFGHRMDLLG